MRETRTAVSSKQLTSEKGEIILTIGRPIKNISIGPNVRLYLFWSFFTVFFFFFVLVFYNDWKETKLGSSLTAITTVFVDCRKNEIFFLKNLLTSERQKERGEREKKKGLIVYAHYCAVQAAKPSPPFRSSRPCSYREYYYYIYRRGWSLCGYDDPSGQNRNVDGWFRLRPRRGWSKAKEGTFFFLGGCPFHRLMLYVWGRSVAITLTIWRRTAVYYYYLSSPTGDNNFVFFSILLEFLYTKNFKKIYYLI